VGEWSKSDAFDEYFMTVLCQAAHMCDFEKVKWLVSRNASPNLVIKLDKHKLSVLHMACRAAIIGKTLTEALVVSSKSR